MALEWLFDGLGVKQHLFRAHIRSYGVCLANAVAYGSQDRLREELCRGDGLIVPLRKAKSFKYVKICLVTL